MKHITMALIVAAPSEGAASTQSGSGVLGSGNYGGTSDGAGAGT